MATLKTPRQGPGRPFAFSDGKKWCGKCLSILSLESFRSYRRKDKDQYASYCTPCERKAQKERWRRDPEKSREKRRKYQQRPNRKAIKRKADLKKAYGITPEQYDAMNRSQGGACAICKNLPNANGGDKGRLHVDHCHTTGKVRGLLCNNCNNGLGRFRDSSELLTSAAAYIEAHLTIQKGGEAAGYASPSCSPD